MTTLVVGLGNPGPEYARNRHNIGFMAVDAIVRRHGFGAWRKRFQGRIAEGALNNEKLLALHPETFMNLSGQAVAAAVGFYKLSPNQVVVFHDELDLPPGRLRVKQGGGAGGHNGLRSIDDHIGKNYWRVRLGIGHPGHRDQVSGYVLHDFAKNDQEWLTPLLDVCADFFPLLIEQRPDLFMNRTAERLAPKVSPNPSKVSGRPEAQTN
ncbi:Peptidyl-tRNA hydrolase [Azospirillaceae bacterium]